MHARFLTAIAVIAFAVVCPAAADAKRIGKAGASGDYAVALASGSATRPRVLRVKVTSKPRQRVSVFWTMVCSRGTGAGSKSGDFTARTPVRRKLRKPMRRPDDCTVSASAQLDDTGRIKVRLYAFR